MESRKSKKEIFSLVEQWELEGESQKLFCQRHDLHPATFSYWVTKYRKSKNEIPQSEFIKIAPCREQELERER